MPRAVLILSCARAGSLFMAQTARNAGLQFGHEEVLADGGVGWKLMLNWQMRMRRCRAIHQVREPWAAISSLSAGWLDEKWWAKAGAVLGWPRMFPVVYRPAMYWVMWNELCDARAEWTYRVEDVARKCSKARRRLCEKYLRVDPAVLRVASTKTHAREHGAIGPSDLARWPKLLGRVNALSERYGYK